MNTSSVGNYSVALAVLISIAHASTKCGPNEEYNECGLHPSCTDTCQDKREHRICPKICTPGCFCNRGFLRDTTTGDCIPESKCRCTSDEEFHSCGSACEPTCQGEAPEFCPGVCTPGCFCKEGLLRDETSGTCMPRDVCRCGGNSTFTTCRYACPKTCQNGEPQQCPRVCRVGCFCDDGFVVEEKSGECVLEEECVNAIV